jgi:hypothetical protein
MLDNLLIPIVNSDLISYSQHLNTITSNIVGIAIHQISISNLIHRMIADSIVNSRDDDTTE